MNRKYVLATVLCTSLVMTSGAVSAEVMTDFSSSSVTVSGKVTSEKENVNIGIDVLCHGMDYSDASDIPTEEYARVFAYRKQIKSGKDGEWELTFKIEDNPSWDYDAKSGEYTVVISPADGTASYREKFLFINPAETEKSLDVLINGTDAEIMRVLQEEKYALGIDYDFYSEIAIDDVKDILKEEIANGVLDEATTEDVIDIVRKSALIQGLNEGKVSNLFDYKEVLELNETQISDFIDKEYVKINEKNITEALDGKKMKDFSEFDEELTKATVLTVVGNPDGEGNIKEITDAFSDKIGFDAPLSMSAYRRVMGKTYNSFDALKKALTEEKKQSGSGSSGGSGGSKGSGGASVVTGNPVLVVPQPGAEQMEYEIFTDLDDAIWAKDAIIYLAEKGIVNGKTKTEFFPNDTITREEVVKILVLAFAPEAQPAKISFTDTEEFAWYYNYIAKAVGAGIANGYSDVYFGVGEKISRQDLVTMIYRGATNAGIALQTEQIGFADEEYIADYAKEAVGALSKAGIVNGVDFNNFAPNESATRAQMAKIVYRLLEL